jgi:hypothetical protein
MIKNNPQRALLARESKKTCEFPAEKLCHSVHPLWIVPTSPFSIGGIEVTGSAW